MKKSSIAAGLALAGLASVVLADDLPEQKFKVIGTWGNASMYKDYEEPMWKTDIPKASKGKMKTEVQAITDLGLAGSEAIKLLSTGAYDAGFALYAYVVSGNPVFEGSDLALVPQTADEQRKMADAYSPVLERALAKVRSVKLMTNYPFPLPLIACRDEFKGLSDLKGRRIRVFSTTLGDMVEGLGGISVSIPLAEVPTALQRGVVDCAVSSAVAMYNAKWFDVVHYLYEMPIVGAMAFLGMTKARWEKLDKPTQEFLTKQSQTFADKTWAATKEDEQQGIVCLTGERLNGPPCRHGEPAKMKLVRTSGEDTAVRKRVLNDFVLKRFGVRCGAECSEEWNKTVGAAVNLSIPK